MADELLSCYRQDLAPDIKKNIEPHLVALEQAKYNDILTLPLIQTLLGQTEGAKAPKDELCKPGKWRSSITSQLELTLSEMGSDSTYKAHLIFIAALAALQAFQQSNVTGPPLPFDSARVIFSPDVHTDSKVLHQVRRVLVDELSVDGIGAYKLTPNIELLSLADALLTDNLLGATSWTAKWARMRISFLHQRILSEESSTLQTAVYDLMAQVEGRLSGDSTSLPAFLQEQAAVHTHHGFDRKARQALDQATKLTGFEFALTGLLGKRTKWQEKDLSQLVVLAKSRDDATKESTNGTSKAEVKASSKPENLDLNDDTLLESISFTQQPSTASTDMKAADTLPASLLGLDPGKQPLLHPIDSITLLLYASSITNTSPGDGLTREETLPYATRVLDGGSSNWQVYTQALLVRSRIEGYRSRTAERGLLQLQALVDQVIAETAPSLSSDQDSAAPSVAKIEAASAASSEDTQTTFLPRIAASDSAPASQRLRYIYPLCSPTRWELEAELAERWVSLGGLRSALEIYERLEMWAEAALCWAATEREDKARVVVRQQLFHCTAGKEHDDEVTEGSGETWSGEPRSPPPADAPRLYCILGDIDADATMYEQAWIVSGKRYARAQRSLGRLAFAARDFPAAATAYKHAVSQNQLSGTSWFALGCAQLEMQDFADAADSFTRTVQLDDTDAEAWSNLASALLNLGPDQREGTTNSTAATILADDDFSPEAATAERRVDPQKHKRDALKALNKAASLKFNNYRIWDNVLTVAASLIPPAYTEVVAAQKRIIEMRGATDGERCVDETILAYLVRYVIAASEDPETGKAEYVAGKPGLQRMVLEMVDKQIVPLITASARLWGSVAKLALWRGRPGSALEAHEKAWRALTTQPEWEASTEARWNAVVDATVELADAYESLGQMGKTEGLAAGSGELVAKDWKFKARSAVKSIMGKGKEMWEDSEGWGRLQASMDGLKSS